MIRTAAPQDAEAIAAIYGDYVRGSAISFETEPPSPEEMAGRIETVLKTHPWLVAEAEDGIAGYAYASPHRERAAYRWSVDVAVYMRPTIRRRGAGRLLYDALFRILSAQNFHKAFAGIALPNSASVSFHEAMGFTLVGVYPEVGFKFGAWRHVGWWERTLALLPAPPPEPVPFPALPVAGRR